ncbi:hypothetical protein OYT1_ch0432 [Ferriphaselus amnicola]|uniref:Uncharacterized protein n=1 Tax=Ferriphaselus amnicola TaxID=1188319 RepID=A0A2Z6G9M0_9PROT|nr:hypothetical protein [Ferriphaselus amnicola]BBE50005.1 hypothetical protein OYT1_ch0432 [Ferriphaselus amnicola]
MNLTSHKQRGFALVIEIFALVLIAALAVAGLSLAVSQQAGVTQDVRATEAELAARAGLEWATYQTLKNDCGNFAIGARSAPVSAVAPLAGSLADFQVVVTASAVTAASAVDCTPPASGVAPASAVGWAYAVSAVATTVTVGSGVAEAASTQAGRAEYAERTLRVRIDRN